MPLYSKILANPFSVMSGSEWQPVPDGVGAFESQVVGQQGTH